MADSVETWRETQRRVLTARRGTRVREDIAVASGLKYWRYVRLENGEGQLKATEIPKLARGYGIEAAALAAELGVIAPLQAIEPTAWKPRADLEAAGVPESEIQTVLSDIADYGFDDQRASVSAYLELHAKKQNRRTRRHA